MVHVLGVNRDLFFSFVVFSLLGFEDILLLHSLMLLRSKRSWQVLNAQLDGFGVVCVKWLGEGVLL